MEDGSQLSIQCRLCSATRNLISLLAGKGREKRDLIRKITYVTTGIEFQEGDGVGYICLTCVVHIYNFYIFQHRSLENAERLRVLVEDPYQPVSKKNILDIGDIVLPDISDLKDIIVPWFNKKRETFFQQKNYADSGNFSESQDSTTGQEKYDRVKTFAKTVQCQELELKNISTQTCYKTATVASQCNINKDLQNKSVQTISNAKNKKVQCEENLESNLSNMDLINSQCLACKKTNNEVVQNGNIRYDGLIPIKKKVTNRSVQCSFSKKNALHNILNNDIQYKLLQSRSNCDKITSDNLRIKISPNDSKKSKSLEYVHQGIQCELIEMADKEVQHDSEVSQQRYKKRKTPLEETSTQTKISIMPKMCCEDEKVTFMMDVKDEISSPTLSSNKSLHISTESLCKIETAYSPTEVSQNSKATVLTDLLAIGQRVDYVKICSRCDQTLYSKSEVMKHTKKHMICPYCKKSFSSIRKTNIHKEQECDKKIKTVLKIHLEPLEFSRDIENYPDILLKFRTNVLTQNNVINNIKESIPCKPPPKKIKLYS